MTADEQTNSELFWALRGGGGNFGAVVRFTLRLHPFEGAVLAGLLYYPIARLQEFACLYSQLAADAPDELGFCLFLRRAPAIAELPSATHGLPVFAAAVCAPERAQGAVDAIDELRSFGPPIADLVRRRPYVVWQQALDPAWGAGLHNEWMGHYLDRLDTAAVDTLTDYLERTDSMRTDVKIFALGGAVAGVDRATTAFGGRDAAWAIVIQSRWDRVADSAMQVAWTRELHRALRPSSRGDVYVNFVGDEDPARVLDAYPPTIYRRLQEIKGRWDPGNLFRVNLNVPPFGTAPRRREREHPFR